VTATGAVYLDCNATTPLDPRVRERMLQFLDEDFGNADSRTHEYGARAKEAVEEARVAVAAVVDGAPEEILFTSGATESNNIALLGLAAHGSSTGRRHILASAIEHKAVLEPVAELGRRGFEVELVPCAPSGGIDPDEVRRRLRPETLLVTLMHANNETGVIQPLDAVCEALRRHEAYLHVDAAQGFGKEPTLLRDKRIDLVSVSGHKVYGPKGIGALITRKRAGRRPPIAPLVFGGGQERGLRPGTLPVYAIAGLGLASELAEREGHARRVACEAFRTRAVAALAPLEPVVHGDPDRLQPHVLNVSFPGIDAEAAVVALRDRIAFSTGSACTSRTFQPSHVLASMSVPEELLEGAMRFSWCHATPDPDWSEIVSILRDLQRLRRR